MARPDDVSNDDKMQQAGEPGSVSAALGAVIRQAVRAQGGWLAFDRFMALALYQPGLGYYANAGRKFGLGPGSGSDFVTAPEMSPLFGRALAAQVRQALQASGSAAVMEFGAGSGALAEALLDALGEAVQTYEIVDLSGTLRARQQACLARFGSRVRWLDRLPEAFDGVIVGNEVLDAMPVQLLHFDGAQWLERGVALAGVRPQAALPPPPGGDEQSNQVTFAHDAFTWADRPTALRPPVDGPPASGFVSGFVPGTVTEIHPQAEAFIRSIAAMLRRGLALFIDYGFPEQEYYLPQRIGGTLMCHQAHRADGNPLLAVGDKDITAHVNFTGIALAAQDAGLAVLGYTSQARFLLNCGLVPLLEAATLPERTMAQRLINEHEMGELFKVIALARGLPGLDLLGFAQGDRSHRL